MSRWFRFYADTLHNPKVLRLSDKDYRTWTRMLAVAAENEGHIPPLDDLKLVLGMRLDHLKGGLNRLIRGGLIDALDDGYEPHGWAKFQYKSDTSTDRVHKHRAKRNVSETPPDTESETDTPLDSSNELSPPANDVSDQARLKPEHVVEAWNDMAERRGLSKVVKLTPERRRKLATRIRQSSVEDFTEAIGAIERSPFLRGENDRGWKADFDFLLQPKSFTKLIEGSYG